MSRDSLDPIAATTWDGTARDAITPAEAHEVAANWKDTTQLSNALDAAAFELDDLRTALARIENWPYDVGHSPERDLREIKEAAHDALAR